MSSSGLPGFAVPGQWSLAGVLQGEGGGAYQEVAGAVAVFEHGLDDGIELRGDLSAAIGAAAVVISCSDFGSAQVAFATVGHRLTEQRRLMALGRARRPRIGAFGRWHRLLQIRAVVRIPTLSTAIQAKCGLCTRLPECGQGRWVTKPLPSNPIYRLQLQPIRNR